MVGYKLTISEDCKIATVDVTGIVFNYEEEALPDITNTISRVSDSLSISHELTYSNGIYTFVFEVEKDDIYSLTITDGTLDNIFIVNVLVNCRSIKCGNLLNKKDVDLILIKKNSRLSKTIDNLNRVVISNFRLGNYTESIKGLELIEAECESCNCGC